MFIPKESSFCFIGDSITAAEGFTRIIIDYFVLNFPDRHIKFYNTAIPGFTSGGTLKYWEDLITPYHPTHATIMFGMNDLGRSLYADSARITEELLKKRENSLRVFSANMETVLDKLKDASYLLMTPTPYDESPSIPGPLYGGYDNTLAKASATLLSTYPDTLDLHSLLSDANAKVTETTIIGPDRVHPGNIGQVLIAKHILEKMGIVSPRLPLWEKSITEDERKILHDLGIVEDTTPENPFSDARKEASRRAILFRFVEFNSLLSHNIDIQDKNAVNEKLNEYLESPIEEWRKAAYKDYMENSEQKQEIYETPKIILEQMYTA